MHQEIEMKILNCPQNRISKSWEKGVAITYIAVEPNEQIA